MSLLRIERHLSLGLQYQYLEDSSTFCPFSKIIEIDTPLELMTATVRGTWLGFQCQIPSLILLAALNPIRTWLFPYNIHAVVELMGISCQDCCCDFQGPQVDKIMMV